MNEWRGKLAWVVPDREEGLLKDTDKREEKKKEEGEGEGIRTIRKWRWNTAVEGQELKTGNRE